MYPHFNINDKSFNENNENISTEMRSCKKFGNFPKFTRSESRSKIVQILRSLSSLRKRTAKASQQNKGYIKFHKQNVCEVWEKKLQAS